MKDSLETIYQDCIVKTDQSSDEWEQRVSLAAVYRLLAIFGMGDLAGQYLALRCKDRPDQFLTHAHGSHFEEVTASNLLRIDQYGRLVHTPQSVLGTKTPEPNPGLPEVLVATLIPRPKLACLLHGHSPEVTAVSSLACGLLPLSQHAIRLIPEITYWSFVFVDEGEDYQRGLHKAIDNNRILLSHNHGFYILAKSVSQLFHRAYYLNEACRIQLAAQATGVALVKPSESELSEMWEELAKEDENYGAAHWPGLIRKLDSQYPEYKA